MNKLRVRDTARLDMKVKPEAWLGYEYWHDQVRHRAHRKWSRASQ